jgi:antitoxin (DNA-binding transcriptional repressor) of toxin-antitoxin stability system
MFHHPAMNTVAVRDLRQRWPKVEAALAREGELFVTRDGKVVARLVRIQTKSAPRKRFSADQHLAKLRSIYGRRKIRGIDEALAKERADG